MLEQYLKIDVRGTLCPMPALMVAKRLKTFAGASVEVLATDPMAEVDIGLLALEEGFIMTVEHLPEGVLKLSLTRPEST